MKMIQTQLKTHTQFESWLAGQSWPADGQQHEHLAEADTLRFAILDFANNLHKGVSPAMCEFNNSKLARWDREEGHALHREAFVKFIALFRVQRPANFRYPGGWDWP